MIKTANLQVEVVVKHTCLLGEGPVWDAKRKTINWVDILNGEIHEFYPSQSLHRKIDVKDMVGSVALCTDGNFIAALKTGLAFINRDSGEIEMLHHPEAHLPGNRFNDGKCDPAGRFWVGSMGLLEETGVGNLYMIDNDLSHLKKIEGVSISNGMAWSSDHKTFYYIDTPTYEVVAYDYDLPSGNITNKRIAIKISKEEGSPDGMTIDAEDKLWIAHWDGWQVTRWDPATATKLLNISLPVARVTSCTFGGDNFNDLYITSAKVGLTEKQLQAQSLAGSLFVIRDSGFRGMEAFEFDHQTKAK
jgi:sugar lactone lactonase YvrE